MLGRVNGCDDSVGIKYELSVPLKSPLGQASVAKAQQLSSWARIQKTSQVKT